MTKKPITYLLNIALYKNNYANQYREILEKLNVGQDVTKLVPDEIDLRFFLNQIVGLKQANNALCGAF